MEYDIKTTPDFGLNISIGKSEITINAADISQIAEKGFHFKLADGQTVEFGELKDFIKWLNQKFGADLPDKADASWPQGIKDLLEGILGTQVSLKHLKIDQEKQDKDKKYPPIKLEVSVNAKPSQAVELVPGLSVTSVSVGFKRDYVEKGGVQGRARAKRRR